MTNERRALWWAYHSLMILDGHSSTWVHKITSETIRDIKKNINVVELEEEYNQDWKERNGPKLTNN